MKYIKDTHVIQAGTGYICNNGSLILKPTAEQLTECGYTPYETPETQPYTPPPLTPEQQREFEYRIRIPRTMIDAYTTYLAEGDTEKAQAVAAEIAAIKAAIRQEYPDL